MTRKTIAVFGATGGCAGQFLALALRSGHDCVALARTPAKLTRSLLERDVPTKALDAHLTVIAGDIRDISAVKNALVIDGRVVDLIVSGIGRSEERER